MMSNFTNYLSLNTTFNITNNTTLIKMNDLILSPSIPSSEMSALYDLYNSTNGPEWTWITPYNSVNGFPWNFTNMDENPCLSLWQGILCIDNSTSDSYFHIGEIYLPNFNLSGTLPSSIEKLTQLEYLTINSCDLYGKIPNSIGNLSNLIGLDLDSNKLSGTIPSSLKNCSQLYDLTLFSNQLSGVIPEIFTNLPLLMYLVLSENFFTGVIPNSLKNCTIMEYFAIEQNFISSSIPEIFINYNTLHEVVFGNNLLTGILPNSLVTRKTLTNIYLSFNYLYGDISEKIGDLSYLKNLNLNSNLFSSTIPNELSKLSKLESLILGNNKLYGNLNGVFNPSIQNSLNRLEIYNNQLTGKLSEEIFQLKNLNIFIAYVNCFEGELPKSICSSKNIFTIVLNGLSSATSCRKIFLPTISTSYSITKSVGKKIPECLFQLSNLTTLQLSGNQFTGSIPSIDKLNIFDLSLSHNALTGVIPEIIQERKWYNLDLSYNYFSGNLLETFNTKGYDNVSILLNNPSVINYYYTYIVSGEQSYSLQNNYLSGNLPETVITLKNISILNGNLFSCNLDRSDLPKNDIGVNNYQCGSNSFEIQYYLWLGLCVLFVGIYFIVMKKVLFLDNSKAQQESQECKGNATQKESQESYECKRNGNQQESHESQESHECKRNGNQQESHESQECKENGNQKEHNIQQESQSYKGNAIQKEHNIQQESQESQEHQENAIQKEHNIKHGSQSYKGNANHNEHNHNKHKDKQDPQNKEGKLGLLGNRINNLIFISKYCTLFIILILLPFYCISSLYSTTYEYQYAWTAAGAYLSGVISFGIWFVFFVCLIILFIFLFLYINKLENIPQVKNLSQKHIITGIYFTYIVINIIVVITVNSLYVYTEIYQNNDVQIFTQIMLSFFKVIWNRIVSPYLLRIISINFNTKEYLETDYSSLQIFVSLFNTIIIPCLVVMCISPNCFYDVFVPSPEVKSTYSYEYCNNYNLNTEICLQSIPILVTTTYNPPFTYSYQCSSSFITHYTSPFLIMCIISTFVIPCVETILSKLYLYIPKKSLLFMIVDKATPQLLKPIIDIDSTKFFECHLENDSISNLENDSTSNPIQIQTLHSNQNINGNYDKNTKINTNGKTEVNTEENTKINTNGNTKENTEVNTKENTEVNTNGNTNENIKVNTKVNNIVNTNKNTKESTSLKVKSELIKGDQIVINLITYLGLILTFGSVFPPLAVCLFISILSISYYTKYIVNNFLNKAKGNNQLHYIKIIEKECELVGKLPILMNSMFMIIIFSICFYTMFLFDTLGSSVGLEYSYWILILSCILLIFVSIFYTGSFYFSKRENENLDIEMVIMNGEENV